MKTIEINVYKFDELSEAAQSKAIEAERLNGIDTSFIYSEAKNTVERFYEIFNIRAGSNSLNYGYFENEYLNEILDFSPERLKKYILNNFSEAFFKGKYYSLWSKKDKNPHYTKNGSAPWGKLKTRHSRIILEKNRCSLTGMCYDESILQPIYAFLDGSDYQQYDLNDLFSFCFEQLNNDIDNEIEAMQGDEYISESLQANDYDFLESGQMYS